jgi:hypothetical protein
MSLCIDCRNQVGLKTKRPLSWVDLEEALNLKPKDGRVRTTVSAEAGRPAFPRFKGKRVAEFWWMVSRPVRNRTSAGLNHRMEWNALPVPHIAALALYRQGFGLRGLLRKLGCDQPDKWLNPLKRAIETAGVWDRSKRTVRSGHFDPKFGMLGRWKKAWRQLNKEASQESIKARRLAREAKAQALKTSVAMLRYYQNHERSKRRGARVANRLYYKTKKIPFFIVRRCARAAVARIARKVGQRRTPKTRTYEYLGCNYDEARRHIEAQFRDGMTWENHGTVWEIDHIRPLASFDLLDDAQKRAAMHFSNLQPLFVQENRAKSDKWEMAA